MNDTPLVGKRASQSNRGPLVVLLLGLVMVWPACAPEDDPVRADLPTVLPDSPSSTRPDNTSETPEIPEITTEALSKWKNSCLYATLECARLPSEAMTCTQQNVPDLARVDFASGARAWYFKHLGQQALRVSNQGLDCFEIIMDAQGWEITDTLTSESFQLKFVEDTAQITCLDGQRETIQADLVRAALPNQPAASDCAIVEPEDQCQTDADCNDESLACCNGGDRMICSNDCAQAAPKTLCQLEVGCGGEGACCLEEFVRVCDFAACNERGCCFIPKGRVCKTEGGCRG